ncbi:MAG: hypothetical protein AAFR38_03330 [Planctomycetota bacterium]
MPARHCPHLTARENRAVAGPAGLALLAIAIAIAGGCGSTELDTARAWRSHALAPSAEDTRRGEIVRREVPFDLSEIVSAGESGIEIGEPD